MIPRYLVKELINIIIQVENFREFSYFLEKYYITSHLPCMLFSYEEDEENIKKFFLKLRFALYNHSVEFCN